MLPVHICISRSRTGRTISIRYTIFPKRGLHITWSFWTLLVTALTIGPVRVVTAVLAAAAMHEGGHIAMLRICHIPVEGLRLNALGAELYACTERLSYGQELAVTLAGPATDLVAAFGSAWLARDVSWEWGYLFAGAHLLLGVYNLLPILPLDGGRALYLLTAWRWGPDRGAAVACSTGICTALSLNAFGVWQLMCHGGAFFALAALCLLIGAVRQYSA